MALRAALACLSLYPMASTIEMLERRASLSDSAVCVRVYVCICVCVFVCVEERIVLGEGGLREYMTCVPERTVCDEGEGWDGGLRESSGKVVCVRCLKCD